MYNYTHIKAILFAISFIISINLKSQNTVADTTKKSTPNDTIRQNVQVSFIPFFGTNGIHAGKTINRFSLNIFAGHSMGVDGFEAGGFANINKADVRGFQAAGFANVVGRNVNGFQAAGFTNVVGKNVQGFQSAGFVNVVGGTFKGFQAAGFTNVNRHNVQGFQAAGFVNVNGDTTTGATLAGYANVCKVHTGAMLTGGFNYAHYKTNGVQIAGLFNYADTISRTAQIAGLFNISTKGTTTTQIAGLINIAKNLKGVQLGFLNYADTVTSGVPIGFISIVRKGGVHQLEVSFDELLFLNLAVRTGTRQFHNIFTSGINVTGGKNLMWTFGYGAGTTARLSNRLNLDVDITANHINKGKFNQSNSNLAKLYLGLEVAATKNFKVAFGPTFNVYVADTKGPKYGEFYSDIAPYCIFSNTYSNGYNIKGWIGGKIALRFF